MSFGYGVGDFISLSGIAWKVYTSLSTAPEKFRNLSGEVNSMHASLRLLEEALKDNKLSEQEKSELCSIGKNCEVVLQDVLGMLKKFRSLGSSSRKAIDRVGFAMEDISEMRSRLVSHTTMLISFQSGLQSRRQDTILDILVQIRNDIQTGKRARSVLTTVTAEEIAEDNEDIWQVIAAEIEDAGLEGQVDESERYFIGEWIEEAISNGELESVVETQTNADTGGLSREIEPLEIMHHPNREPPSLPGPFYIERDDSVFSGDSSIGPTSDRTLVNDDLIVQEIIEEDERLAVVKENDTLFIIRQNEKGDYPLPWSWEKHPRGGFYNRITFHRRSKMPALKLSSFSAMAYETAPRCIQTIERLEKLLQVSGMGGDVETGSWDQITNYDAFHSLKLLRSAMTKYGLLQNQDTGLTEHCSDLDALVVETTIIRETCGQNNELLADYPQDSIDMCKKNYYGLLKETMAFLYRFSIIFSGKTYVMEERSNIVHAWNEKKMMARSRSIELKLQGWDIVEAEVRRCRNWIGLIQHRKDEISRLATNVMVNYEAGRRIVEGYAGSCIEITVISATGVPSGSRLRPMNASFKVRKWTDCRTFSLAPLSEEETRLMYESQRAPKTNEPVWNESFALDFDELTKTNFTIEVWDTILGISKNICNYRTIYMPRNNDNEPTFGDKSLLYGYDEIRELPLKKLNWKSTWEAAGTLKVRMKWEGRYERIKRLGFPESPPSIFYHTGELPMPAWPEDGVHATDIDKSQGWIKMTDKKSSRQGYVDLLTNTTSWNCPDPSCNEPKLRDSFRRI